MTIDEPDGARLGTRRALARRSAALDAARRSCSWSRRSAISTADAYGWLAADRGRVRAVAAVLDAGPLATWEDVGAHRDERFRARGRRAATR